ncbi:MAG: tetratricopeptide repeat protein [Faecalibacterium sp.]
MNARCRTNAVWWYQKAAEQGHAEAQYALGDCYRTGEGVTKNGAEAVKWYRKAAEQGHVEAQNMLGICYHNGDGVAQDNQEAVKWCGKAAENGLALAQYNMGFFCEHGVGGANEVDALKWYRKAAEQGNEDAKKAVKGWKIPSAEAEWALPLLLPRRWPVWVLSGHS